MWLSDVFDTIIIDDLQIDNVLDVLRKDVASVCGSENSVNKCPFLGNLKHSIEIGGKVELQVFSFTTIAGA